MNDQNSLQKITDLLKGTGVTIDQNIPAIEVKNFSKKFRNFLSVKDASFTVNHGVIHGFIGPNGSGKTTTIKSLIGAYIPTKGHLTINGKKVGSTMANKAIGYIPERASFPKHLNVLDYLKSMAKLSGVKGKDASLKSRAILQFLGLWSQRKRKPITFSSGMQKKVLLAQSLLTDPSILILDEPAANLDPSSRQELFQQLVFLREQGKTIFISSHVLAELEKVIDEVTFIYYGNLLFSGTVNEFTKRGSTIFIKSTDNEKLMAFLDKRKIKYRGDVKNEIELVKFPSKDAHNLLKELTKTKIEIVSYRTNDLQASYERLAQEANQSGKNVQELKSWLKVFGINKNNSNEPKISIEEEMLKIKAKQEAKEAKKAQKKAQKASKKEAQALAKSEGKNKSQKKADDNYDDKNKADKKQNDIKLAQNSKIAQDESKSTKAKSTTKVTKKDKKPAQKTISKIKQNQESKKNDQSIKKEPKSTSKKPVKKGGKK